VRERVARDVFVEQREAIVIGQAEGQMRADKARAAGDQNLLAGNHTNEIGIFGMGKQKRRRNFVSV
jgi:hypothetical protein